MSFYLAFTLGLSLGEAFLGDTNNSIVLASPYKANYAHMETFFLYQLLAIAVPKLYFQNPPESSHDHTAYPFVKIKLLDKLSNRLYYPLPGINKRRKLDHSRAEGSVTIMQIVH
jgi:hypothetical protein